MEVEKETPNGSAEKQGDEKEEKKKNKDDEKKKNEDEDLKKKKKQVEEVADMEELTGNDSDFEVVNEFWMPPVGDRWDNDDGDESENDDNGEEDEGDEGKHGTKELSKRAKRMSLEIGPSSFASRKKKKKIDVAG